MPPTVKIPDTEALPVIETLPVRDTLPVTEIWGDLIDTSEEVAEKDVAPFDTLMSLSVSTTRDSPLTTSILSFDTKITEPGANMIAAFSFPALLTCSPAEFANPGSKTAFERSNLKSVPVPPSPYKAMHLSPFETGNAKPMLPSLPHGIIILISDKRGY